MPTSVQPFPEKTVLEDLSITGFPNAESLFERILFEITKPEQSLIFHLNIHGANIAYQEPKWREIIQHGDVLYCDGAGIVLGAKLLGKPLSTRLTAADWLLDLLSLLAEKKLKVFFLAGEPEIAAKAAAYFDQNLPNHTIVGIHHGFILDDPNLEESVINQINALQPDILFVGMGMPHQEFWIHLHRNKLKVKALWAIGATLDYLTQKVPRCPPWMGRIGLEWMFRLLIEPNRMFDRYIKGNPWFLSRILYSKLKQMVFRLYDKLFFLSKNALTLQVKD